MNTINSVYYGWGFLILCGGGSYYFAKRSINADRSERAAAAFELQKRQNRQLAGATHHKTGGGTQSSAVTGGAGVAAKRSPGSDEPNQGQDGMADIKQKANERDQGKEENVSSGGQQFESKEPYRSRKGDRFS